MVERRIYTEIDPTGISPEILKSGLKKLVPYRYLHGIQPHKEYDERKLYLATKLNLIKHPILVTAVPCGSGIFDHIDKIDKNTIYALTILDGHHRARANATRYPNGIPSVILTIGDAFISRYGRILYPTIEEYIYAIHRAINETIHSFNIRMEPKGKRYNPQQINGWEILNLPDF